MKDEAIISELVSAVSHDYQRISEVLTDRFSSFSALARAELYEIDSAIDNLSVASYIKIASELAVRRVTDRFKFGRAHTDEEIENYLRAVFLCKAVETVYLISIDSSDRVISSDNVCDGTINRLGIIPRRLLEIAHRRGARKVIIAHNHPGGIAEPSRDDISTSAAVMEAFCASGIEILKNYIVSDGEIKSFLS